MKLPLIGDNFPPKKACKSLGYRSIGYHLVSCTVHLS